MAHQTRDRDIREGKSAEHFAKNVYIDNPITDPIPTTATISAGEINIKAPTGPFKITVASASTVASNPLPTPLTDRVSLSIRNKSSTVTLYLGTSAAVTADDTATGGWEIGPNEDFNLDLDDSEAFFLITPSGSATIKIFEIAST